MSDVSLVENRVELQLGPAASVEAGTEAEVTAAFEGAGLGVTWRPIPGDRSLVDGAPRAAEASLHVLLTGGERDGAAEALRRVATALAEALAEVRRREPDLPLAVVVTAASGRQRFALSRDDDPDQVFAAINSAASAAQAGPAAFGWDSRTGAWRQL